MADKKAPVKYPEQPRQPSAPPPYDDAAYPPPPEAQGQPPVKGYSQPGGAGGYSQPPVYYGPPQGQQTAQPTVVITTVSSAVIFRDVPVSMQCPNCHNHIISTRVYKIGGQVLLIALFILFLGPIFWLGLCLIPFCIDGLKDVRHVCPVCNYQLGVYKRL